MDTELIQDWIRKIEELKNFLNSMETQLEDVESSESQSTGKQIAYDFDIEDIVPDIEAAISIMNDLYQSINANR